MTDMGTITFQWETGSPLKLKDVFFIPRLKKNLVFAAVLEDSGYDAIFRKGKVFLRNIAMGRVK